MAKTIAGKLIAGMVDTFKSLFPYFIQKTYRKIEPELRQEISWITQIVSKINDVLQSPGVDVIAYVIPGNADDKFVEWARIALPLFISKLKEPLSNSDKAKLSAELTHEKTGMKLSQSFITSQVIYEKENA